jgi:predicted adenylyl cyclase CyaB
VAGVVENESKHRVVDRSGLVVALSALGFAAGAPDRQVDEYYDGPERPLAAGDLVCRLRVRDARVMVAFKGPRQRHPDGSHWRVEIEFPAGDLAEARASFARQGLMCVWRLEKRRRRYRRDGGGAEVCLDELPRLGLFVELEGDPTEVRSLRSRLGGLIDGAEPRNYQEIALAAGAPSTGLVFP